MSGRRSGLLAVASSSSDRLREVLVSSTSRKTRMTVAVLELEKGSCEVLPVV